MEMPPYPGIPRWVKAFGIIFAFLGALFAMLAVVSGDHHGPNRHMEPNRPPASPQHGEHRS